MGYENLQPALERFKMTAGFIAGGSRNTDTVFDLEDRFHDSPHHAAHVGPQQLVHERAARERIDGNGWRQ